MSGSTTLTVIGAGSWGTALAIVLAPRFERVRLWAHDDGLAAQIQSTRVNETYLPGFTLPASVEATDSLQQATADASTVLLVVPSRFLRSVVRQLKPHLRGGEDLVSATKGIEDGTLARMSQVIREESGSSTPVAVLSGPTFAREIARGEPAAVVIASDDDTQAGRIQRQFSGPTLRLYTNSDPVGVEIGAALKNVVAIGAGIVQGLGLGNNTTAALVTRGLAEITRLAVAAGGRPETLAGLAGLGDLLLTCTGDLSRNRRVGIELAQGRTLQEILGATKMIPEGVDTVAAAVQLAARLGVEMPIARQMDHVLRSGKSPKDAVRELMDRALRSE
ncbi:MAG: NAD(P)H-dependent glycerol-3-phosphate dehydrogenase [Bryobacteraceae bacterium]|nr:NAD(P)H-dependent glycerol-3-phosphate dehydrogenase [Bryobacteraceae bacterium]